MSTLKWLPACFLLLGCGAASDQEASDGNPKSPQTRKEKNIDRNLSYGRDAAQSIDFYRTDKAGSPMIVFIHGGAWQGGSRNEYDSVAREFQKAGVAVASIDYRLSPMVEHPSHAEDVAKGIAWLTKDAERYGFDKGKVFVAGHSAGAHIAATIATDPDLLAKVNPAGFVGIEGIYDLPALVRRFPGYPNWFLNNAFGPDQANWAAYSPSHQPQKSKAPWLLIHSKADELVDMPQTDGFAAHLQTEGVKVERNSPEDKTHFGVIESLGKPNDPVAKAILNFVLGT